jgi:hypothetical protein
VGIAIGAIGEVIVAIRGGDGPGEVLVKVHGTKESFIAESVEPIPRGQTVLVIEVGPHRHVTVVPWIDFAVPH